VTDRIIIIKVTPFLTSIAVVLLFAIIWNLEQNEIIKFESTIHTALSITFIAPCSFLSIISMKYGNTMKLLNKNYLPKAEITELTYLFVHLKTKNRKISIVYNSLVLQKSVSLIENQYYK